MALLICQKKSRFKQKAPFEDWTLKEIAYEEINYVECFPCVR